VRWRGVPLQSGVGFNRAAPAAYAGCSARIRG